jgi:copper(I)-binding protein
VAAQNTYDCKDILMIKYVFSGAVMASALVVASQAATRSISIENPWARETVEGQAVGGGFMTIVNNGKSPDQLVSASSPVSSEVQIHTMSMERGVMRMRQLTDGIAVPANGRVELKPRSHHIMFMGVKKPLRLGTNVPVTLNFRRAGSITVQFKVQGMTAPPPK